MRPAARLAPPHTPGLTWPRGRERASRLSDLERERLVYYERLMGLAHLTALPVVLAASLVQLDAIQLRLVPTLVIAGLTLAWAVGYHLWLPRRWLSQTKVIVGLLVDIGIVSVVVHLTGDHMSLLVFLYYLIVIVSALTLNSRGHYTMCALVSGSFLAMLPADAPFMANPGVNAGHIVVFVLSVWLVGVMSAAGAAQIQSAERRLLHSARAQRGIAEENAGLSRELTVQLAETRALASDLERQRQETRRLADMVIRAQEEERRRVARELHDEANQSLAALMTTLDVAEAQAAGDRNPELVETISRLRRMARATLADLQRIAVELRPPALDEFGLLPALTKHVTERTLGTGLRADVAVEGRRRRLPPAVEVALYRVAQESLANVQKHAGAGTVHLRLRFGGDAVQLDVSDNGVGFDPAMIDASGSAPEGEAAGRARLGLAGMRERAAIVGGTLSLTSRPGGGTRISACIPLDVAPGVAGSSAP